MFGVGLRWCYQGFFLLRAGVFLHPLFKVFPPCALLVFDGFWGLVLWLDPSMGMDLVLYQLCFVLKVLRIGWFLKIILKTQMLLLLLAKVFLLTTVSSFSLNTRSSFEVKASPLEVESPPSWVEVYSTDEGLFQIFPLRGIPFLLRWNVGMMGCCGYGGLDELGLVSYRGGVSNWFLWNMLGASSSCDDLSYRG